MKIAILTLGCKVNQAESQEIEKNIVTYGHEIVELSEYPDFCIVNTCTVTSKSDYQSRQLIRRAYKAGARVIVTGCYSELNHDAVKSMDGVEKVYLNKEKSNIINMFNQNAACNTLNQKLSARSRCFVKVQDGCNNSCSYCAIPQARGKSKSSLTVEVIANINEAVANGFNEVVLTGIHLGCYGLDLKPKVKLSGLIATILNKTKINRIRLSSLELNEVNEELLELMREPRLCKHIHIPLQSGDNRILKAMNRHYNRIDYEVCIKNIAKRIPDATIGTDVIAGFPGEGESEFNNTYALLESLPLGYIHAFPYSPRPNTAAVELTGTVSSDIKKKRVATIVELSAAKKKETMIRQINKELDVLIENINNNSMCYGTSGNYLKVLVRSDKIPKGSIAAVNIKGLYNDSMLLGVLV